MADIANVTEQLIKVTKGAKVFSTQIVNCCMYGDKSLEAVVITFDDGRTEVSCSVKRNDCSCRYGYRSPIRAPKPWYKIGSNWVTVAAILVVVILGIVAITFVPPLQ